MSNFINDEEAADVLLGLRHEIIFAVPVVPHGEVAQNPQLDHEEENQNEDEQVSDVYTDHTVIETTPHPLIVRSPSPVSPAPLSPDVSVVAGSLPAREDSPVEFDSPPAGESFPVVAAPAPAGEDFPVAPATGESSLAEPSTGQSAPAGPANAGNTPSNRVTKFSRQWWERKVTRMTGQLERGEAIVQGQQALNQTLQGEIAAFEQSRDIAAQQVVALGGHVVAFSSSSSSPLSSPPPIFHSRRGVIRRKKL
ncbi:unnamed protein product [Clonostachys rosea]|uniref:Uncharacterized protein n=1 Tax=Bionectria ochroleuca TaxID=29856 RepID=A0ABY6TZ78_BIOOC|nr:unnamed protein product [Clonostachys rosea]